jgi:superfamily II DNA helicase RecQ
MRLVVDSTQVVSGSSLHLKVGGFCIEVSDISSSGKVAIVEDSGKVSIEVLPIEEGLLSELAVEPLLEDLQEVELSEPLSEADSEVQDDSSDLFQRLVELRKQLSREFKLPPYIIFHDTSLKEMVSRLPVDLAGLKDISGVGDTKLEKYGARFVEVIKEYISEKGL